MLEMKEWDGFEGRLWKEEINVRQFIQDNYTPYDGNEDFLAEPTEATNQLWGALQYFPYSGEWQSAIKNLRVSRSSTK